MPKNNPAAAPRQEPAASSSWPAWVALGLVVVLLVALGARRIWTADYWWQWKTGEYVASHGVPDSDVFSYTRAGHPRLELRWGYCLGLYEVSRLFGRGSAVVFKCAAILAMFGLAAGIAARRRNLLTAALVTAIAALAASQRFFVRPEILTYLFFATFLFVIELARRRRTRAIWVLPAVQVLWVNSHGLFVLGPALLGAWLVGEALEGLIARRRSGDPDSDGDVDAAAGTAADRGHRLRTAAWLLAATLAASLVNPYFHRALLLPLLQFGALHGTAMKEFYTELRSPFAFAQTYGAVLWYELLIALTAVSVALNWRRQQPFRLIVVAAMLYLSATAIRNLPLFALAALPLVVANLSESPLWQRPALQRRLSVGRAIVAAALSLFCVWQVHALATDRAYVEAGDTNQFGIGLAHQRYPRGGTEFLRAAGSPGPVFNSSLAGAYLLAHDVPVFIDPRGEIYLDGIIEEYRKILDEPVAVHRAMARYGLRVFFLETEMTGLIDYVRGLADWRIVYADSVSTILFRRDVAPELPALDLRAGGERWLAGLREELGPVVDWESRTAWTRVVSPAAWSRAGRFCFTLGAYAPARALLEDARAAYPPAFTDYPLLAFTAMEAQDWPAAVALYDRAIARRPDDADLRKRSARALVRTKEFGRAAEALDAYFSLAATEDAEALALRGIVDIQQQRFDAAAGRLGRAVELSPGDASYRYFYAQTLVALRRLDGAVEQFEAAWRLNPSDVRPARDLAQIAIERGDLERARVWVERAYRLAPQDPGLRAMRTSLGSP